MLSIDTDGKIRFLIDFRPIKYPTNNFKHDAHSCVELLLNSYGFFKICIQHVVPGTRLVLHNFRHLTANSGSAL